MSPTHSPDQRPAGKRLPFVSVIAPTYNGERLIARCIEALLVLDYPKDRHEIIIVDNASKDNTARIIKQYPVTYLLEDHTQSSYAARNAGARVARGEILAFLDGDCIADPLWLSKAVCVFLNDATVGAVGGRVMSFPTTRQSTLIERFEEYNGTHAEANQMPQDGAWLPFAITANALYRRPVFDQLGGFRGTLRSGGDALLSWRMQQETVFRLTHAPEAIVYHQHITKFRELLERSRRYGRAQTWAIKNCRWAFRGSRIADIVHGYMGCSKQVAGSFLTLVRHLRHFVSGTPTLTEVAPLLRCACHVSFRIGRIYGSMRNLTFFP